MLIDGNKIAKTLEEKLVTELLFATPKKVCFVIFENSPATEQFVKVKSRVAERLGIHVTVKKYPDTKNTEGALKIVHELGKDDYDGIVIQLPVSKGIDTQTVLDAVPPLKDIDLLGATAKESYVNGKIDRTPPVAQAVREIFEEYDINLAKKKIALVGHGRLVGEPIGLMFQKMKLPYDVIDIKTGEKEKLALLKNADIIISGICVPHSIKPEMIKNGVVLIDAGTSEQAGKLVGNIDPECEGKASLVTPVPGGVGPITIVSLLRNLF